MSVVDLPLPASSSGLIGGLDRIRDEQVREAARRYEAETGKRLADAFGGRLDDELVELFLILRGYPPGGA